MGTNPLKGDAMNAYRRILVPTDGTTLSLRAAREAATLARGLKATITAVYVKAPWVPPMMVDGTGLPAEAFDERAYLKAAEATAQAALGKVSAEAGKAHVQCETLAVTDDEPWKGIVKAARAKKCDLIVMASHGRSGVAAVLLGSETRKVLAHATKPVLVCH
jgi:nucleotide-binding universal stress UspA family protein